MGPYPIYKLPTGELQNLDDSIVFWFTHVFPSYLMITRALLKLRKEEFGQRRFKEMLQRWQAIGSLGTMARRRAAPTHCTFQLTTASSVQQKFDF